MRRFVIVAYRAKSGAVKYELDLPFQRMLHCSLEAPHRAESRGGARVRIGPVRGQGLPIFAEFPSK